MNQLITQGIILSRIEYGEADRIISLLTPDQGKLRLMAKGVRRPKSKLAGGIELFSVSSITFIKGRGDIGTLVSTRLIKHYGDIVSHLDRVQLGYELIKQLDKATEDEPESDYFELLQQAFAALNEPAVNLQIITLWFQARLLTLAGHQPNLVSDSTGIRLSADQTYAFDIDTMSFSMTPSGRYSPALIKLLRLVFAGPPPTMLQQVSGIEALLAPAAELVGTMFTVYIRR